MLQEVTPNEPLSHSDTVEGTDFERQSSALKKVVGLVQYFSLVAGLIIYEMRCVLLAMLSIF